MNRRDVILAWLVGLPFCGMLALNRPVIGTVAAAVWFAVVLVVKATAPSRMPPDPFGHGLPTDADAR